MYYFLFQLAYSITGLTGGIKLAIFLAGFFVPRANTKVKDPGLGLFTVVFVVIGKKKNQYFSLFASWYFYILYVDTLITPKLLFPRVCTLALLLVLHQPSGCSWVPCSIRLTGTQVSARSKIVISINKPWQQILRLPTQHTLTGALKSWPNMTMDLSGTLTNHTQGESTICPSLIVPYQLFTCLRSKYILMRVMVLFIQQHPIS